MELTKSKLHKILKKYRTKLIQHNNEWKELCDNCKREDKGDKRIILGPSIYDHERYNSKGNKLFSDIMSEFEQYDVFPKNKKAKLLLKR